MRRMLAKFWKRLTSQNKNCSLVDKALALAHSLWTALRFAGPLIFSYIKGRKDANGKNKRNILRAQRNWAEKRFADSMEAERIRKQAIKNMRDGKRSERLRNMDR